MHVSGFPFDLSWFLQFIFTAFVIALGLLHLVKNTASKYFTVDSSFEASDPASPLGGRKMPAALATRDSCEVCGNLTKKQCSGCKLVKYCSERCQRTHWNSEHKTKCKDFQLSGKANSMLPAPMQHGRRGSSAVALVPASGTANVVNQPKEILFPYEEFVQLFNWDKPGCPPCGLLNCGNSCFANVVLQCLCHTRPLVAYLLVKGHRRECRRNDWCFLCEFQNHVERASESQHPFSPINILSRLPKIGGNLGYGKQEDAHEFMRFAIDTMQSVCLEEFGGEKALHTSTQETTLIQHIFGGHLQSQVICAKCNNISNQCENMMDLTVEIHGDAASLEECLDQFTVREQLHGDNMYKCDGCNDYVMAWKRLTIRRAPNILTIALKRFQSGRFGKLNKRVTFPETLDLRPYMSEGGDGKDIYKLYAVVVHVDMLNASFFGHYICYTKDFCGNWYRIDDCKVTRADLEEVLSQGAYMLLYSRICARPTCLKPIESLGKEKEIPEVEQEEPSIKQLIEESTSGFSNSGSLSSQNGSQPKLPTCGNQLSLVTNSEVVREDMETDSEESLSGLQDDTDSPVGRANRLVSGVASSLNETCKSETFSPNSELTTYSSGVEHDDGVENNTKKFTGSSESSLLPVRTVDLASLSNKSSLLVQNGSFENVGMSHDASVGISAEERVDEMNSTVGSKGVEVGVDMSPSSCVKGGAMKISGRTNSGAKSKPLFAPGFLGKRPGSKSVKRDGKAPTEMSEIAADACKLKKSSESSKPGFVYQNGNTNIKHIGEPHAGCDGLSPPSGEQVRNFEPGQCSNFCNGDAGACVVSDVGNTSKDDETVEGITSNRNMGLHEEREPILTE